MTLEQLATEALSLPSEERALLADRIVESLDTSAESDADRRWLEEACRRDEEVQKGRVKPIPGEEALASVRRSLGR